MIGRLFCGHVQAYPPQKARQSAVLARLDHPGSAGNADLGGAENVEITDYH
jgi:hypothetical protein